MTTIATWLAGRDLAHGVVEPAGPAIVGPRWAR